VSQPVLPDVSIRQLEYLVAVADAPTWAAAAGRVGVSPSALSQGLAELERRIGVELFEPHGRRRVMRPAAAPVLDHARQVVGLTRDLVDWTDRVRTARAGRIRVGMIDVAAVTHFPDVVGAFRRERPDVELVLSVAPSGRLLDDLRDGTLDLVACVDPPTARPGIETAPLRSEPLVVIAPAGADLDGPAGWGPWVLFPVGSHTRLLVAERLRQLGAPLRIAAESHQPDVLVQMVVLGLGWTVLPLNPVVQQRGDLAIGPELVRRRLVLAMRAGSVRDPAVDELASRLRTA
jgi:DNA-binding transcriptional LysR family regulator